jgi:hypothetical protein
MRETKEVGIGYRVQEFMRCVGQDFNEMLHDRDYWPGFLLAGLLAFLFSPIFVVPEHPALKVLIAIVVAVILSLPFLLMLAFALYDCRSFLRGGNEYRGSKAQSQVGMRAIGMGSISGYLFNLYGVRNCYPSYFGDLNLEIKKGFGTYCQGETYEKYFCLALYENNCLELVELHTIRDCINPWAAYGEPITGYGTVVGAKLTYVLPPGDYVIAYARYSTPLPYGYGPTVVDVAMRGIYPTDAVIKRFRVVDSNRAEVIDSWACSGYGCRDIEDAFRKMCAGDASTSALPALPQSSNTEEHKGQDVTSPEPPVISSWPHRSYPYLIIFPFLQLIKKRKSQSREDNSVCNKQNALG